MEIITNEAGGKQSKIRGKMTEVPPLAWLEVSEVMGLGSVNYPREADGTPNWKKIDCLSNTDHALEHMSNFLAERNKPKPSYAVLLEEYSHFAARAFMGLDQLIEFGLTL